MPNILFVCKANRFRSVIAAEYFRSLLIQKTNSEKWVVGSAGTWAIEGLPPIQQAIGFSRKRGFNIERIRSREVNLEILNGADLILVMTEGQKEALCLEFQSAKDRIFLLSDICTGIIFNIPDPVENQYETSDEVGSEMCDLIEKGFERIFIKAMA
ncbi:MAG: hypothetical protein NTZ74_00400 [Chloroflexi bacterium]|nr:hypothetical protein [Chloroflexota bacterium]